VLAPGHDLTPKSVQWHSLRATGGGDVGWMMRDGRMLADGALEVFLVRSEEHADQFDTTIPESRAWPSVPPDYVLIEALLTGNSDELRAFQRDAQGRYTMVEHRERDIVFQIERLPAADQPWYVGLEWHGLSDVFAAIPAAKLGETMHVKAKLPVEGASVYWLQGVNGSTSNSMPVDSIHAPIVLR
jgi:hypothetical protein